MNFNVDCQQSEDPCLTKVVPLLVLVKEWGELGDDAFKEIDIVLLLLQGVQQADADKVGALYLEIIVRFSLCDRSACKSFYWCACAIVGI